MTYLLVKALAPAADAAYMDDMADAAAADEYGLEVKLGGWWATVASEAAAAEVSKGAMADGGSPPAPTQARESSSWVWNIK